MLAGAYAVLSGVTITAATSVTRGANNRITGCRFRNNPAMALLVAGGRNVRVDRCEFAGCRGRGISVKPTSAMTGLKIDRNRFHDFVGVPGSNGFEAIQLGQGADHAVVNLKALIEMNLFERVSVDNECISVKCAGNTVRLNTLLDSKSRFTNRFGKNNKFLSNWSENAWGILIRDANALVVGNRILKCGVRHGLRICAGDVDTRQGLRHHNGTARFPSALDAIVAKNEADSTIIGFTLFEDHTLPATGTRILGHIGPIEYRIEQGTVVKPRSYRRSPRLVRLTPADVGPGAPGGG